MFHELTIQKHSVIQYISRSQCVEHCEQCICTYGGVVEEFIDFLLCIVDLDDKFIFATRRSLEKVLLVTQIALIVYQVT
jgi:hypothetical protein